MNKLEAILAKAKAKGFESLEEECTYKLCDGCYTCSVVNVLGDNKGLCPLVTCVEELLEPYEEPRKLTEEEYSLLKGIQRGYIARDKDGFLHVFDYEPKRFNDNWIKALDGNKLPINRYLFHFITWYQKPYSVEELLTWEVED